MKDNGAHCVTSFPSGDSRQRFWEGEREEPGDGGNSRRQRAGHQHQEHPHRHRLRGHTLPRDPGMELVILHIDFVTPRHQKHYSNIKV